MTVLIIGIILALLSMAASLYHIITQSPAAPDGIAYEHWWMGWPM